MCYYYQLNRAAFSGYSTNQVERDAMKIKLFDNAARSIINPKRFKLGLFRPECKSIANRQLCPKRSGGLLIYSSMIKLS